MKVTCIHNGLQDHEPHAELLFSRLGENCVLDLVVSFICSKKISNYVKIWYPVSILQNNSF